MQGLTCGSRALSQARLADGPSSAGGFQALDVRAGKTQCVHPGRKPADRCKDCPLRKKAKAAMEMEAPVKALDVQAGKTQCVHPGRKPADRCKDCPLRKKGKASAELTPVMASQEEVSQLERLFSMPCPALSPLSEEVMQVTAAKGKKCIHPMRPLQGSCRDCPRRKGLRGSALIEGAQEEEEAACAPVCAN